MHNITFDEKFNKFMLLSKQEVIDLIDFFYRWRDTAFKIITSKVHSDRRGAHLYDNLIKTHLIYLYKYNIISSITLKQKIGGNITASNEKVGAAMVLVHELQHANQSQQHRTNENFYTEKKYYSRPCERDARSFVDNNIKIIEDIVGSP